MPEPEADGHIKVPKFSMVADYISMSPDELPEEFVEIARLKEIEVSYSVVTNSLSGYGSYESLKELASEFDTFVGHPPRAWSIVKRHLRKQ